MGRAQKLKQQRKEEQAKKQQEEKKEVARKVIIVLASVVTIALTVFLILLVDEMKKRESEKPQETQEEAQGPASGDTTVTQNLLIETTKGQIVIGLFGNAAPLNVQHMVELASSGYYDNLRWYRVEDFVVQTGSHYQSLVAESGGAEPDQARAQEALTEDQGVSAVPDEIGISATRGRISFAKPSDPETGSYKADSATTDFFILKTDRTDLDPYFSVFGEVVSGMEVVDSLTTDDMILTVTVQGV